MKKWERIIIYPLTVLAALYSFWSHDRLQAIYKLNSEKFIPAYEELQAIQDPNTGLARLYGQLYSKPSPIAGEGWILQFLCEANGNLAMTYTPSEISLDDDQAMSVFKEDIRILKYQLTYTTYSASILETIKLSIKSLEAAVKIREFISKNKEDYQNWINDVNSFKNPAFGDKYVELRNNATEAWSDSRNSIANLMGKI